MFKHWRWKDPTYIMIILLDVKCSACVVFLVQSWSDNTAWLPVCYFPSLLIIGQTYIHTSTGPLTVYIHTIITIIYACSVYIPDPYLQMNKLSLFVISSYSILYILQADPLFHVGGLPEWELYEAPSREIWQWAGRYRSWWSCHSDHYWRWGITVNTLLVWTHLSHRLVIMSQ